MKYYKKRVIKEDYTNPEYTRCWTCRNACGGCSWSREFKPVDGWNADKTTYLDCGEIVNSYFIKSCPEYERG